jgi:molybdopterin synthase sulfur carrier subunit
VTEGRHGVAGRPDRRANDGKADLAGRQSRGATAPPGRREPPGGVWGAISGPPTYYMATVYIPTPFRRATANRDRVDVSAPTVGALLDELERTYGGLKGLVRNEAGHVHQHVAVYVNSEPIDGLAGLGTPLKDGDEVAIIPALAGGAWS